MDKLKETIASLKASIHSTLTKDSSADEIKRVEGLEKQLDDVEQEYDKVVTEKQEVTDLYIKYTKQDGSKEPPKEENKEPRSLEEIAKAVTEQDKNNT